MSGWKCQWRPAWILKKCWFSGTFLKNWSQISQDYNSSMTILYDWTGNREWIKTLIADKSIIHLIYTTFESFIIQFENNKIRKYVNGTSKTKQKTFVHQNLFWYGNMLTYYLPHIKTFLPRSLWLNISIFYLNK